MLQCEGGGKHYPFGRGFKEFLEDGTEHLDINRTNICQLPISEITNDATDAGVPLCLSRPDVAQRELDAFGELAKIVARELFQLPHKKTESQQFVKFEGTDDTFDIVSLQLSLDKDGDISLRAFSEKGAVQKKVDPFELRSRDPKTGAKEDATTEKSTDASSTASQGGQKDGGAAGAPVISLYSASEASEKKKTIPVSVEKKGGYGYAVEWADGATYIYSLVAIAVGSGGSLV
uniref:Uncharacterized protein n=1 Tax=Craspedostauros australis TaxID=1486917 RepID=A0A7R9ZQY8_9STRA|mmetsp:Transcript_6418/g.17488  ORF Transcript_6418/g.17488 Transcript_6418/m.17488 type:complete len:233 (+) Transcript_6418:121-819(+)